MYIVFYKSEKIIFQLFIDNEWVDSKSGKTFKTYSPADGSLIAKVSEGGKVRHYVTYSVWIECVI